MTCKASCPQMLFQSTLPRGSDILVIVFGASASYFNPRSLAGATFKPSFAAVRRSNFNPRSLAGATYAH